MQSCSARDQHTHATPKTKPPADISPRALSLQHRSDTVQNSSVRSSAAFPLNQFGRRRRALPKSASCHHLFWGARMKRTLFAIAAAVLYLGGCVGVTDARDAAFALDRNEPDKSIELATKVLQTEGARSSTQYAAYVLRAGAYIVKRQYDLAIPDLNRALDIDPRGFSAYANRGLAYAFLGKYDLAIADHTRAIMLDSG